METADTRARARALRASLRRLEIDALLLTDIRNIRYLSGFTGSSAYLLVTWDKGFLLTDSRYTTQAGEEVRGFKVRTCKKALDELAALVDGRKIKSLGFESDNLTHAGFLKIKKALTKVRLKSTAGLTGRLRVKKDAFEIERIRECARALDLGFERARKILAPGVTEKAAAFELEFAFKKAGAEGLAFDTIIASGPRGALPHGKASEKKIRNREMVVVDMGVLLNGYNSDGTRTYCVGRPTALQKKVYGIVKDAQARAIDRIRPGAAASDVDGAARSHIEKSGYGRFFGHGTGHGVGLEIHEPPSLSPLSDDVLEEGMVVTVEPGIYLPGQFGVRIEDMALVVKGGCELLTKTPRDIVCL